MFYCGIDTAQAGLSWASSPIHLLAKYKHEATVIDGASAILLERSFNGKVINPIHSEAFWKMYIIFAILSENRPYEAVPPKRNRHDSAHFTT